jgi:hypothetical protein
MRKRRVSIFRFESRVECWSLVSLVRRRAELDVADAREAVFLPDQTPAYDCCGRCIRGLTRITEGDVLGDLRSNHANIRTPQASALNEHGSYLRARGRPRFNCR